jgi:purine-nucleoside phosphorylase
MQALNQSGVSSLVILDEVASPSLEVGTWVAFKDHCLFAGSNPLLGENVDVWGERFPDASSLYSQELRALAEDKFLSAGLAFKEVFAVHTDSARALQGPAFEQVLRLFEAEVLTSTAVHAALVSSHKKMDSGPRHTVILGEVTRRLETVSTSAEPNVLAALQVVRHLRDS